MVVINAEQAISFYSAAAAELLRLPLPAERMTLATGPTPITPPAEDKLVRRFYGTKSLDPQRMSRDADQIAMEVVKHLVGLVDANVEIKIEISADVPSGVGEDVVRTVTENAKTLKFEQHGFEES